MLSFEEALNKLLAAARPVAETRSQPLTAALGRRGDCKTKYCSKEAGE